MPNYGHIVNVMFDDNPNYSPPVYYGDGGYVDSAENALIGGFGGFLESLGAYTGQEFGFGQGMEEYGRELQIGRQARRKWDPSDAYEHPLDFITDPNGLTYTVFNQIGSSAPDIAATLAAGAATSYLGGAGGAAVATGLRAARMAKAASTLEKAISVGADIGELGTGAKIARAAFNAAPEIVGNVAGGYLDAASEAGDTYNQAIQNGATQEEARNAMDTDFMDNIGMSIGTNAIEMGMFKGALKAPARLLGSAGESTEQEAGKGLLGSLSDFGGKVADFADKNYATRFLTHSIPGTAVESYTEGLQNEFQNSAITGESVNYNPLDMDAESKSQMFQAGVGMLPMALLGGIGHRRARRVDTTGEEKVVTSPIDDAVHTQEGSPNVEESIQDEAPVTENIPVDENELTQGDIDQVALDAQRQAEAQAAAQAQAQEQAQTQPANAPVDINAFINNQMDNPSDADLAERAVYGGDSKTFPVNQAIANVVSVDGEPGPLGYNPVHGNGIMTGKEKEDLTNALVNSPQFPMIDSAEKAKPVVEILANRNDNKVAQNQAQQLVQAKKDLGLPVTEADMSTTTDVHPNSGHLQAMRAQIKEKRAQNRAELKASKEAHAKAKDEVLTAAKDDIAKNGTNSEYYINEKGEMSDAGRAKIENKGLTLGEVSSKIGKASKDARTTYNKQRTEVVKAVNEKVKADLAQNGVNSKYYSKDGKFESLPNETRQELTRASMGQIDNTTLNHIAKMSAVADKNAANKAEKDRAFKAESDRIAKINQNTVGIKVDTKKMEGLTPSKRKAYLDSQEKKVAKAEASKKLLEEDIAKAREIGVNPKELEGKNPSQRKKYLESQKKKKAEEADKKKGAEADQIHAHLVDKNEYGVKVGDMDGMTKTQRKNHLERKRKEVERRKKVAEEDAKNGYEKHRVDKGEEKHTGFFANALSKLAKQGKEQNVKDGVHHFLENFFNYRKLSPDAVKKYFAPKFREKVENALREYANARTKDDFDNDREVRKVTQLVTQLSEEAKKPEPKKGKVEKETHETYSPKPEWDERRKSRELNNVLKKAEERKDGSEIRIATAANDQLVQEIRETRPKDGNDAIHYWLHHEELEEKYGIKNNNPHFKDYNRAQRLAHRYGSAIRNDGKRNVISPLVRWVGLGAEKAAGGRNFPNEREIQKLIDNKVYTPEEIKQSRAEYEKWKKISDENEATEAAEERERKEADAERHRLEYNKKLAKDKDITYETDPKFSYNDKDDAAVSEPVNMTVKVKPAEIRGNSKDDIAFTLESNYGIIVEGKNIEVVDGNTVKLKDAVKRYEGDLPERVYEAMDEKSQQAFWDSGKDIIDEDKGAETDEEQKGNSGRDSGHSNADAGKTSDTQGDERQGKENKRENSQSRSYQKQIDDILENGVSIECKNLTPKEKSTIKRALAGELSLGKARAFFNTLKSLGIKSSVVSVYDKENKFTNGKFYPNGKKINLFFRWVKEILHGESSEADSARANSPSIHEGAHGILDALQKYDISKIDEILHDYAGSLIKEWGTADASLCLKNISKEIEGIPFNSAVKKADGTHNFYADELKAINNLIGQIINSKGKLEKSSKELLDDIVYSTGANKLMIKYLIIKYHSDKDFAKAMLDNYQVWQEIIVSHVINQCADNRNSAIDAYMEGHDRITGEEGDYDFLANMSTEEILRDFDKNIKPKLKEEELKDIDKYYDNIITKGINTDRLDTILSMVTKDVIENYNNNKEQTDSKPLNQISVKGIIKKHLDRMHEVSHEEAAQRSALYAAGVIPGKDKANILRRMFEDPLHFFKKYLPDGMHIYRLADEARRNMEKFVTDYSKRFSETFDGVSKTNRNRLCQLILKADEIHRDPMQVIKLDNGLYVAARHDAFIEHYDDYAEAMAKAKELRDSGKYRIVKSMKETEENENSGYGEGYTVFGIPQGSAVFKSETAAQKYCDKGEREAYTSLVRSISGKDVSPKDINTIMNSYKKYRSMMDDIYGDMVTAAKESGAQYNIPKKLHGYFPHLHLPYVVWVKNKDGVFVKTSSYYNGAEASKKVKELTAKGEKAYWAEVNPINAINLGEKMGSTEKLSEEQLLELDKEGSIQLNDSVAAVGDYNHALKKMFVPLFKGHDKVTIGELMKFLEREQRRFERKTGISEYDGYRKAALRQLKTTKLFKKLQRMKEKETITQAELENLINSANMNKKFNPNFQKRTGAAGYSRNVLDSVYRYMVTAGNFTSKAKFYAEGSAYYAQKFGKDIRDEAATDTEKFLKTYIKANHRPSSVTALDNMINDYLNLLAEKDPTGFGALMKNHYGHNIYTGLARDTLSLQNLLKLGLFRPASLAVQAFQVLNANAKLGGNKAIGMSKYFRTGLREATGKKYDAKWKELYDYIGINEDSVALDSELIGRSPKFTEKKLIHGKSIKDFANASMVFFNAGDKWARKATAIGGYLKAIDDFKSLSSEEKKGLLEKATQSWQHRKDRAKLNHMSFKDPKPTMESVRKEYLFNSAKDLVTETNFNYAATDSPLAMTEAGVTGKLLLQFKKYPLFTLNFMLHNSKEENMRFLVPMFIMAGCLGMPCANLVDDLFDKTTGNSPVLALKRHMIEWAGGSAAKKALVNVALYGAPSLAGINLSQNIGLGDAVQFDLGPTVSTAANIANGNGVIRSLAPYLGKLSEAASGQKKDKYGNTIAKYTPYDELLKFFGFTTMTETNSQDAARVMKQAKDKYNQCVAKAKQDYIKNPNSENYEALKIYGMRDSDIVKMMKTKDATKVETLSKSMPKKAKNPEVKEVQNLAKAAQDFTK